MRRAQSSVWVISCFLTLASVGCPASTAKLDEATDQACTPGMVSACTCATGIASTQACASDGSAYAECACEMPSDGSAAPVPCDVAAVLADKCWSCHGETLAQTAPMHLTRISDFGAPSPSDAAVVVAEQLKSRIHSETRPMPPPTMPPLTAAQVATLDAWMNAGMPEGSDPSCDLPAPDVDGHTAQDAGPAADGGNVDAATEDEECYDLLAHAADSKEKPFPLLAGTKDLYNCFSFAPPWKGDDVQGISFKSKIDKADLVHHWLLYQNVTPQADGVISACLGAHPDAALLAGWAVGGSDTILPPDVGMQMGSAGFILEIHYNNPGAATADASGVRVCVTRKPRPHLAATHWLGTLALALLGAGSVDSYCSPNYAQGPIHILSSWPHMHQHGTHMKSTIVRQNGAQETLIDKPFDFNYQISYPTPTVLNPGDRIATTCTYGSGPVVFGEGTDQEMCFNFVVAWPAGSLSSVGTNFTANQCFD